MEVSTTLVLGLQMDRLIPFVLFSYSEAISAVDEGTYRVDFSTYDGPVLRMGVGNVSATAYRIHPNRPQALILHVSPGYRITHLEGTSHNCHSSQGICSSSHP